MIVKFNNPGFTIVDGTATTSLTLNFIPYPTSSSPLCESTLYPIEMGLNDRSTTSIWPDTVSGSVQSKIVWTSPDGAELLCIQIDTKVASQNIVWRKYTKDEVRAIENAFSIWGPEHELESSWGDYHEAFVNDDLMSQTQDLNAQENATSF
jgi:hypothetical protein